MPLFLLKQSCLPFINLVEKVYPAPWHLPCMCFLSEPANGQQRVDSSYSCLKDDSISYPCDDLPSTFKALREFSTAAVKKKKNSRLSRTPWVQLLMLLKKKKKKGCVRLDGPTLQGSTGISSEAPVEQRRKMPSGSPEYLEVYLDFSVLLKMMFCAAHQIEKWTEAGGSNTWLEVLTLNWGGNSEVLQLPWTEFPQLNFSKHSSKHHVFLIPASFQFDTLSVC